MSATRRPTTRRKVVALTVAALGIAGLGLASAAQLNVSATQLGAGTSVVASCDTDGVKVAFSNGFDIAAKGYAVKQVTVSGISENCANQKLDLTLLNTTPDTATAASTIASLSDTVKTGGGSLTFTVTGSPKAADVQGVAVVIAGA